MRKLLWKWGIISKKKYIIHLLLKHYKKVLKTVKTMGDLREIDRYLIKSYTHMGICYASKWLVPYYIINEDWVERNCTHKGYWAPTPGSAPTKAEVINRLLIRINILKKEQKLRS